MKKFIKSNNSRFGKQPQSALRIHAICIKNECKCIEKHTQQQHIHTHINK